MKEKNTCTKRKASLLQEVLSRYMSRAKITLQISPKYYLPDRTSYISIAYTHKTASEWRLTEQRFSTRSNDFDSRSSNADVSVRVRRAQNLIISKSRAASMIRARESSCETFHPFLPNKTRPLRRGSFMTSCEQLSNAFLIPLRIRRKTELRFKRRLTRGLRMFRETVCPDC